jgi:hypothetical protein
VIHSVRGSRPPCRSGSGQLYGRQATSGPVPAQADGGDARRCPSCATRTGAAVDGCAGRSRSWSFLDGGARRHLAHGRPTRRAAEPCWSAGCRGRCAGRWRRCSGRFGPAATRAGAPSPARSGRVPDVGAPAPERAGGARECPGRDQPWDCDYEAVDPEAGCGPSPDLRTTAEDWERRRPEAWVSGWARGVRVSAKLGNSRAGVRRDSVPINATLCLSLLAVALACWP